MRFGIRRFSGAVIMASYVVGCGGAGYTAKPGDLGVEPVASDMSATMDLTSSMTPLDFTTAKDLVGPDMMAVASLDMTTPPDLTTPADLTTIYDLTPPPDLTPLPPDMTTSPHSVLLGGVCNTTNDCAGSYETCYNQNTICTYVYCIVPITGGQGKCETATWYAPDQTVYGCFTNQGRMTFSFQGEPNCSACVDEFPVSLGTRACADGSYVE